MEAHTLHAPLDAVPEPTRPEGIEIATLTPYDVPTLAILSLEAYGEPLTAEAIMESSEELRLTFEGAFGATTEDSFVGAWDGGTLVGAMTQWREQRIREGGTAWRGVAPGRIAIGRTAVLALSALACQLGWLVPVVGYGLASGAGWGPVGDYLGFALLMWVSVTGASLWGMLAVRLIGTGAVGLAPAAAAVWSIVGAVRAEGPAWAIEPWTWTIRSTLPLLGVHGNGEKLEAGAAAWHYPLWPGLLSQIVVAGLALALVIATTGRGGDRIVRRPDLLQRLFRRTGSGAGAEERASGAGPAARSRPDPPPGAGAHRSPRAITRTSAR